jgi:hypothetical protein
MEDGYPREALSPFHYLTYLRQLEQRAARSRVATAVLGQMAPATQGFTQHSLRKPRLSTDLAGLETPKKQKNHDDRKHEAQSSRGGITPLPAMRPSRQRAHKRKNQNHNQDCSKHGSLLRSSLQRE